MSISQFLFMADAHIKIRTWTNNTILQRDAYAALRLIQGSVGALPMSDLVIGGDWFDSNRPTSTDTLVTANFLKGFSDLQRVWYISGNHDNVSPSFFETLSVMDSSIRFIHLSDDIQRMNGRTFIAGVDWMPSGEALLDRIAGIIANWSTRKTRTPEDRLYLVLHTSFRHLLGFDGAYKLTMEDVDAMCKGEHVTVLVGDIHLRDTSVGKNGTVFHSPGSLYPLSYDKIFEPAYVSLIDYTTGLIDDVLCNVRDYYEATVDEIPDGNVAAFLETLPRSTQLISGVEPLPAFLRIVLNTDRVPSLEGVDTSKYVVQLARVDADEDRPLITVGNSTYSLNQAVLDEAKLEGDDELVTMIESVITSDDVLQTTEDLLDQWGVERVHQ